MTRRSAVEVNRDQLETLAFEDRSEVVRNGDRDEVRINGRVFWTPIPAQRTPGDES